MVQLKLVLMDAFSGIINLVVSLVTGKRDEKLPKQQVLLTRS